MTHESDTVRSRFERPSISDSPGPRHTSRNVRWSRKSVDAEVTIIIEVKYLLFCLRSLRVSWVPVSRPAQTHTEISVQETVARGGGEGQTVGKTF